MTETTGDIQLQDSGSKGRYFLRRRPQGAGLRLVTRAVEDARAAGKKIIPLCPFAAAQFRRHPEWADVLR